LEELFFGLSSSSGGAGGPSSPPSPSPSPEGGSGLVSENKKENLKKQRRRELV
jgi:hypothetical protein